MRQRPAQKIKNKQIILIYIISFAFTSIIAFIFFELVHPDRSKATVNPSVQPVIIGPDQPLVNEKFISAPLITGIVTGTSNTLQAKRAIVLTQQQGNTW